MNPLPPVPDKRDTARVFRSRLAEAMQQAGLNRSQLAARARVDRSTLSQLLSADNLRLPRADTVAAIAAALQVRLDWLLGQSGDNRLDGAVLAEVLQIAPESDAEIDLARWHEEAAGYKVCHVPCNLPDLYKTDAVIEFEYRDYRAKTTDQALSATQGKLAYTRMPETDMEICLDRQALEEFARGEGIWRGLSRKLRREQLLRMARLADEQYPALRLHLFDLRRQYSVPFTVFGQQRAVIYVGQMFFVFQSTPHIRALRHHFDQLVRGAVVQARDVHRELDSLAADLH